MRGMVRLREHRGPARAGALEDESSRASAALEIVGGGECVEHAAEGVIAAGGVGENDDGGFGHGSARGRGRWIVPNDRYNTIQLIPIAVNPAAFSRARRSPTECPRRSDRVASSAARRTASSR